MYGIGVNERDLEAEQPAPRPVVDQLGTFGGELVDCGADVVDLKGDVMHPRAASGEKPSDRRLVAKRGEELDPPAADSERRGLDTLVGNGLAMLQARPEEPLVGGKRLIEIIDGDTEMMNPTRLHAADATRSVGGDDSHGADGLRVLRLGLDAGK